MRAKEYLERLKKLDIVIRQKESELEELQSSLTSISGINYSEKQTRTAPSGDGDAPFVKMVDKIIDLKAEINAEIDKFIDERHRIINQIQVLKNPKYIDILYKRYIEFKRFERICKEMNYSRAQIHRLHSCALSEFEKVNFFENLQR